MSNKSDGNTFEKRFCQTLAAYGFWVHNLAQNTQGQPFDVIAVRNGKSHIIDCKVCANNIFKLERVEDNQYNSMELWANKGNEVGWFAIKLNTEEVFMISFEDIKTQMSFCKVMSEKNIRGVGIPLDRWVERCE